jgi:type IX secretion system PorP/SprF family membrane protein
MRGLPVIFAGLFPMLLGAQANTFQSLYMYDALPVNPAYAGSKGALVLNANYRTQWDKVPGSPVTLSASGHLLSRSGRNGLGILVQNDRFGLMNNTRFDLVYAYRLKFKKSDLAFGVAGGVRNEAFDRDRLVTGESSDEAFEAVPQAVIAPDASIGILYKRERFLIGLSAPNVIRKKYSFDDQAFNFHASGLLDLGRTWKLRPSVLVKYMSPVNVVAEGNLTFFYRNFLSFGAGARSEATANAHIRLQLNRQFSVAYLFERNFGAYNNFLRNTHELMINYTFDFTTNVQSPRYL